MGSSPLLTHSRGLDEVENTSRFTDKTENGLTKNCLGYSKKPILSGVLGQLELFELTFSFFPVRSRLAERHRFLCATVSFDSCLFVKLDLELLKYPGWKFSK